MTFSIWFVFLAAVVDWGGIILKKERWQIWSKPLVMICLLLWFVLNIDGNNPFSLPFVLVFSAIIFSLLGDIFLLKKYDNFIAGLTSFLIAHVMYVISLKPSMIIKSNTVYMILTGLMVIWFGLSMVLKIMSALKSSGKEKLMLPVIIYGIVINLMFYYSLSGLYSREWAGSIGVILALGGFLFYISDIILAWNRFVEEIPNATLIVRILYHLGQIGLVTSLTAKLLS